MMKEGLVLEINKNYISVLTKSGEFLKLKRKGKVSVGDTYKAPVYKSFNALKYIAASLVFFIVTSFAGYTAYAHQIVGYVDISGSSSVRLYINRLGTVEKVQGIKDSKAVKNMPIEKAIEKLSTIAIKEGVFSAEDDIDVSTKKLKSSNFDFKDIESKASNIMKKNKEKNNTPPKNNQNDKNQKPKDIDNSDTTPKNRQNKEKEKGTSSSSGGNSQNSSQNDGSHKGSGKNNPKPKKP